MQSRPADVTSRDRTSPVAFLGCLVAARIPSLIVGGIAIGGCAHIEAPYPAATRFEPLLARDLVSFEQQIEWSDMLGRRDDEWLLATAWADLVSCRGVTGRQPFDVTAQFVMASLRLEEARHSRLLVEPRDGAMRRVWLRVLHDDSFFRRAPEDAEPGVIRWQREAEVWLDESPPAAPVASRCRRSNRRTAELLEERLNAERELADVFVNRARALVDADALVAPLAWRAEWHSVVLSHRLSVASEQRISELEAAFERLGELPEAERPAAARVQAAVEALESERAKYLRLRSDTKERNERLVRRAIPAEISAFEQAQMRSLLAFLLAEDGQWQMALLTLRPVAELDLDPHASLASRYLLLSLARRSGDLDLARTLISPLPEATHALFDPMVYEAIRTLLDLGEMPALLRIATGALRDRPSTGPFRSAALQVTLSGLSGLEFDERTVELIEDLGPRNQLSDRMALFARLALENDRPSVTSRSTDWLLEREHDARVRRRYSMWRAVAAFVADDLPAFEQLIDQIAARPPNLRRAIGRRRQAAFFQEQDRSFIALLSEILPRMAEWNGDLRYRDRHHRWLRFVVDRVQEFVRTTPETMERESLSSLYRIASAQLDELPRGYAEHVGPAAERAGVELPVVLGRVRALPPEPELLRFTPISRPPGGFAVAPGGEWVLPGLAWEDTGSETTHDEGTTP